MKQLLIALLIALALSATANTQSTKVVPLEARDTQVAAAAWQALKEAERTYEEVQRHIDRKYLSASFAKREAERAKDKDAEYEAGFEFSEDFKYILPHDEPKVTITNGSLFIRQE